ncbi:MAG: YkgJ family cysteine cluster protein [Bryobacterales bacterium]|nr:YkgJ family cysteine cluster protein [Bryobacteraceae bacterium]MDW8354246.1 YkgJ family cysteine cluster protein [Bryobacterales bacterium]
MVASSPEHRIGKGDELLLRVLSEALEEAARRAGPRLACRIGCIECCIGPFPITLLDAWRLRNALRDLAARDPERAARIRRRALDSLARLAPDFPGDLRSGILHPDATAEEAFATRHESEPCPLLEPESGACELYDARPVSCRTFGPPVRLAGENLPPCRLCFQDSPAEEIEACRVEIDPDGVEEALLLELEQAVETRGETIVAFALALEPFPTDVLVRNQPSPLSDAAHGSLGP